MRIQHNILAMNSYRNYTNNTSALGKNLEKLSSGYKINRAGDDAAGLAISEKMRAQIQGLSAAQKNVKDAISFVKTAEGAMQEIQDMLSRMKYLATQSANGTYQDDVDREALQDEVESRLEEIDRIADSANFNGIYMLNGGAGNKEKTDGDGDGDPDGGSLITANAPVAPALVPSTDSKDKGVGKASITANTITGIDFSKASAVGEVTDGSITVKIGSGEGSFTIKVSITKGESNNDIKTKTTGSGVTLTVGTKVTGKDLFNAIDQALATQVNDWTKNAASGTKEFTGYEGFKLTLQGGEIKGATVNTVKYVLGSDDKSTTAAVPKDTKMEVDLSGIKGNFKKGEVVKIGGYYFMFGSAAKDDDLDQGSIAPADVSGEGTEGNPFKLDYSEDFDTNMENLAAAIKEQSEKLGVSASYDKDSGKLTLTATKDFEKEEDFKNAVKIEFDENSEVGKAIKEAWDKAVDEALNAGSYTIKMQIGDSSDTFDQMTLKIKSMKTDSLGVNGLKINTIDTAHKAIDTIMKAINTVSSTRGKLGAYQNRLEHTQNNLSVMTENIQDAESTIRDTDVADEMMGYVKNNILVQSAQAMLAQANQVPQGVLQLLG